MVSVLSGGALVSWLVPCVPTLANDPSGGFRKGCQASSVSFCGGSLNNCLSLGARHLRACLRDRLLPLPGTPSPVRLLKGVLQAAGMLKSQIWSRRGKRWGKRRRVVCRALLAGSRLPRWLKRSSGAE
ncbi:hypothetical protein Taro_032378 [Colocasia esculenta]|uniref:Secreted protein n=1 Tax=Colocasia esculenta TaxID=4460 RepID=A0A843VL70_COLES|nr:hypothetical protein [Colocasia esculenta]